MKGPYFKDSKLSLDLSLATRTPRISFSTSMVATAGMRAKERGVDDQVDFVLSDASDPLPFAYGVFSAETALGVLESMRNPDHVLAET
jgi:ubiquinone/menaquinone biosynthesis C-methylase UbiE